MKISEITQSPKHQPSAEVSQEELELLSDYLDMLWDKMKDKNSIKTTLDTSFSRHFLDRVNDIRNGRQITIGELERLFKKSYSTYGKKIVMMGPDHEAVLKDMESDVNIPFVLKWDNSNQKLDLIAKTVMRKKNFHSPDLSLVVESQRIIMEGGNVFEMPDDTPLTQRILRRDITPTIKWLETVTGLTLMDSTLGSVGKKESSGDLDLSVDENKISKEDLAARLVAWCQEQRIPQDQILNRAKKAGNPAFKEGYVAKSGISVHFRAPIKGNPENGFVQVDFMFTSDPQWMKFGMDAPGDVSKYSGADRNLIMSSVAKAQGVKYSWQKGLIRREDEQPISKDPNTIARHLFGRGVDYHVFDSVENMQSQINKTPKLKTLLRDLYTTLKDDPKGQDEAQRLQRLLGNVVNEEIKGWKNAASDIQKFRNATSNAKKSVKLVKLKKDGTESKMHDAASYYNSEKEARDKYNYWVSINPGRKIQHNLYVDNKLVCALKETH